MFIHCDSCRRLNQRIVAARRVFDRLEKFKCRGDVARLNTEESPFGAGGIVMRVVGQGVDIDLGCGAIAEEEMGFGLFGDRR